MVYICWQVSESSLCRPDKYGFKFKVAMPPLTPVFACSLGDDVPYDDSVRIHLENQALLRSG